MSAYRRLFVWVEGVDDERFFEKVLRERFQRRYDDVRIIKYANMRKEKIDSYLKSIKSIDGADYIFLVDLNGSPCVTARKHKARSEFPVEDEKIVIVIQEIESWYVAGLDEHTWQQLGVMGKCPNSTDNVTKEDFNAMIAKGKSRIEFMQEVLEVFSTEVAMQRNRSFKYFMNKYCF